MRNGWALLLLLTGCYGIHVDWREVTDPGGGPPKRRVSGFVLNPTKALPMFASNTQFMPPMLGEIGKVAGVRVCVVGAEPEKCSEPSGADGSYILDLDADGVDVELFADVSAAAETLVQTFETIPIKQNESGVAITLPLENRNFYVNPPELFAAGAVASGLATQGAADAAMKAIEKGAGLILSQELVRVGGNYVMPVMIDIDAIGVANLYAVKYDAAQPGGIALEEIEATDPNAPYPIAMALYIGDGSMNEIIVTLCDPGLVGMPQDSENYPLIFTEPMFMNEPGKAASVRPEIPNALARYHGGEFEPPERCN
jgi:hypothetical protein